MAKTKAPLSPPIHRNELFPAMQALVRLWQFHQRPIIVQLAGIEGGEGCSSIAEALANVVYAETHVGILLVTFDSVTLPGEAFGRQLVVEHSSRHINASGVEQVGLIRARMHSSALRSAIAGRLDLDLNDLPPEIGLILLNTEPLLKSFEASAIGSQVDGVFVVVSANATSTQSARKAIAAIANSGGQALGVIVNRRRFRAPRWLARLIGLPVSNLAEWMRQGTAPAPVMSVEEQKADTKDKPWQRRTAAPKAKAPGP